MCFLDWWRKIKFRDQLIAAPLKPFPRQSLVPRPLHFRDQLIAAPLKHTPALAPAQRPVAIPRSADRGPIEAMQSW